MTWCPVCEQAHEPPHEWLNTEEEMQEAMTERYAEAEFDDDSACPICNGGFGQMCYWHFL